MDNVQKSSYRRPPVLYTFLVEGAMPAANSFWTIGTRLWTFNLVVDAPEGPLALLKSELILGLLVAPVHEKDTNYSYIKRRQQYSLSLEYEQL